MSFLRMLGDIGIVVTAVPMTALGTYEVQFRWLVTALWSVSTVNDFTITATLVSLLYIQRSNAQRRYDFPPLQQRTGIICFVSRTAALVDKLIVWTIGLSPFHANDISTYNLEETGMLTRLGCP
jgi:hypothetical protein